MAALSNQLHTLGAAPRAVPPTTEQAKVVEPIASTGKMVGAYANPQPTSNSEDEPRDRTQGAQATTNRQEDHQGACVRTQLAQRSAITIDDVTDPDPGSRGRPLDNHIINCRPNRHQRYCWFATSSAEVEAYTTARVSATGTSSMFLTASEGIPTDNPCASSTRKKDDVNGELSMQTTRGSQDNSPDPSEGEDVISPEQLRFTVAISVAMSKELAPCWHDAIKLKPGPVSIEDPKKVSSMDGSS